MALLPPEYAIGEAARLAQRILPYSRPAKRSVYESVKRTDHRPERTLNEVAELLYQSELAEYEQGILDKPPKRLSTEMVRLIERQALNKIRRQLEANQEAAERLESDIDSVARESA